MGLPGAPGGQGFPGALGDKGDMGIPGHFLPRHITNLQSFIEAFAQV